MSTIEYKISKADEYACLIIGDEVLDGHVTEINCKSLSKSLIQKGYSLKEVRIISDDIDEIANSLHDLRNKYSFVVTTGGIGPTHDDITLEAVAKSFSCKAVLHQEMYNYCKQRPKHTDSKEAAIIKMSTMPAEMEVIKNDDKWPLLKMYNCYVMPGLPTVCISTIAKLAQLLPKKSAHWYGEIFLNVYEHAYFEWLNTLAIKYKDTINIGSYPLDIDNSLLQQGIISKITLSGRDYQDSLACFNEIVVYTTSKKCLIRTQEITKS